MKPVDPLSQEPSDSEAKLLELIKAYAPLRIAVDRALGKGARRLSEIQAELDANKFLDDKLRPMAERLNITEDKLKEMIRSSVRDLQRKEQKEPTEKLIEKEGQCEMIKKVKEARAVSICSDVHLGTKYAKKKDFYHWLESRRADEQVILLGDILDCWIFSKHDDEEDLAERVIAEWTELCAALSQLHKQGTEIHYIPGNHDAFVFFIEMADLVPWCQRVMERSQEFETIKAQTPRVREFASIHYPFFKLEVNGGKTLLTHGHYQSWGWRLMAGISGRDTPAERNLFLVTASIILAHKHARLLRRFVNEIDWMRRVHGIEDIAISITNLVVAAFEEATKSKLYDDEIVDLIDAAMEIYFGDQKTNSSHRTKSEEITIRDALLGLSRLQGKRMPSDLNEIWHDTMDYLRRSASEEAVSCRVARTNSPGQVTWTPFRNFLTSDQLVFGHHHIPRDDARAYEVGGFVTPISTHLSIRGDGSVFREL
ncbi:MAG: metallophosphoesterase [Nitrospira sp.]|nr:metallophosphoesterase [Nitrospira sp.]